MPNEESKQEDSPIWQELSVAQAIPALQHNAVTHLKLNFELSELRNNEQFIQALRDNSSLQEIHFFGKNVATPLTELLIDALNLKERPLYALYFTQVDFGNDAGRMLVQQIGRHPSLKILSIHKSLCHFNMNLNIVIRLFQSIQFTQLEVLDLADNKLGHSRFGGKELIEQLASCINRHDTLKKLNLEGNYLIDVTAGIITQAVSTTQIECLNLSKNDAPSKKYWGSDLAEGLRNTRHLKILDLSSCKLDDKTIKVLAEVLPTMPQMQRLNLQNNHITSIGADRLRSFLITPNQLIELRLDQNFLGRKGAMALSHAVGHKNCQLRALSLNINGFAKAMDVVAAAFNYALNDTYSLVYLSFSRQTSGRINIIHIDYENTYVPNLERNREKEQGQASSSYRQMLLNETTGLNLSPDVVQIVTEYISPPVFSALFERISPTFYTHYYKDIPEESPGCTLS